MVEGDDSIYREIGQSLSGVLPTGWQSVKVCSVFCSESSTYVGNYASERSSQSDFAVPHDVSRAIRKLRRLFQEASKPLWGGMRFSMDNAGKFTVHFHYEECDADGNANPEQIDQLLAKLGFNEHD